MSESSGKKHFYEIDFIRVICCMGIILYHYAQHEGWHYITSFSYANGHYAQLLVSVFFCVSGFVLYMGYQHRGHLNIRQYLYRRAMGMLPEFYIAYLGVFLLRLAVIPDSVTLRPFWTWIFTLTETDGYLSSRFATHYQIGDWFSGALIIVYLLFPLLLKLMKKSPFILILVLGILDMLITVNNLPTISLVYSNLADCMLRFSLGMLCAEYSLYKRKSVQMGSFCLVLIMMFVKLPVQNVLIQDLCGAALFIVLFAAGSWVMKLKRPGKMFKYLSRLSYPVFLLQHVTVMFVLMIHAPESWFQFTAELAASVVIILAGAYCIKLISGLILNSHSYLNFERRIMNQFSESSGSDSYGIPLQKDDPGKS